MVKTTATKERVQDSHLVKHLHDERTLGVSPFTVYHVSATGFIEIFDSKRLWSVKWRLDLNCPY